MNAAPEDDRETPVITCKNIMETASDYLDESPGFLRMLALKIHLILCKHCRRYVRQIKLVSEATGRLSRIPEPADEEIDALLKRLQSRMP